MTVFVARVAPLIIALALPATALAQNPTIGFGRDSTAVDMDGPDAVARDYLRALGAMAWDALALRLHPEALGSLRLAVDIPIRVDTTGWALEHLGRATDRAEYQARSDSEVFTGVMGWIQREVPGLLSSLVSRETAVIGIVQENDTTAHAVYRVRTIAYGALPSVQVATLARTDRGWTVIDAPEIRTLVTALRGMPIPARRDYPASDAADSQASSRRTMRSSIRGSSEATSVTRFRRMSA